MPGERSPERKGGAPIPALARSRFGSHFSDVHDLKFSDAVLDHIRSLDGRYHQQAYLFVLAALEFRQRQLPARGHISGGDLSWACRDFGLEQFGLTARSVLEYWGIFATEDIGRIVFSLIDLGLLVGQPDDRLEDFDSVYDFAEAFEGDYPWAGMARSVGTP